MNPITKAISIFGTQKKLADACDVSQVTVHKWLKGANIKPEHAIKLECVTKGQVNKQEVCPDFPWIQYSSEIPN
jgi:DNA-binding transcriptional regulator YdaS (Cro superfamily)